jgi:hypothetical protein
VVCGDAGGGAREERLKVGLLPLANAVVTLPVGGQPRSIPKRRGELRTPQARDTLAPNLCVRTRPLSPLTQDQLRAWVDLIREYVPVEMVTLFGSYARRLDEDLV